MSKYRFSAGLFGRISLALGAALLLGAAAEAQSLRPSSGSMQRQVRSATAHDFTYLRNAAHLRQFVRKGWLVPVRNSSNMQLAGVSFPYARPEVKLFLNRLSRQYRTACGERLVVTSLTRPRSHQPRNASKRSVHPTGMALDLRISKRSSCRRWIEKTLLYLEGQNVLEVTRERWPPHYHLALFPKPYKRYVDRLQRRARTTTASTYRVNRGDTLWQIARRHGTTTDDLRRLNGMRSSRIYPGQTLKVPSR